MVVEAVGVGVKVLARFSVTVAIGIRVGYASVAVDVRCVVCRLATEVLLAFRCTVACGSGLRSSLLGHLHLRLVALVVLAAHCGQEVDEEAQHIPGVNKRNDPLKYGGYIPEVVFLCNNENDAQDDFGQDESKFDPKGDAEDRVLAVVNSQALVFPADEDRADNVANNKDTKTDVVHAVVVVVVVDGKEDKTDCAYDCSYYAEYRIDLLPDRCVRREFAGMTQIALEDKGEVESNNSNRRHGDEHGLEVLCTNIWIALILTHCALMCTAVVPGSFATCRPPHRSITPVPGNIRGPPQYEREHTRDVRNMLPSVHSGVLRVPLGAPIHQHGDQHGHPYYRAEYGHGPKGCHQHDG